MTATEKMGRLRLAQHQRRLYRRRFRDSFVHLACNSREMQSKLLEFTCMVPKSTSYHSFGIVLTSHCHTFFNLQKMTEPPRAYMRRRATLCLLACSRSHLPGQAFQYSLRRLSRVISFASHQREPTLLSRCRVSPNQHPGLTSHN